MIGVCVPAHNEAAGIARCVDALQRAAADPALDGEPVEILVMMDACTDATSTIVAQCRVHSATLHARNVGVARGAGAAVLMTMGARWLAFTDADTQVSSTWLSDQLSLGVEAVCGVVAVDDWTPYSESVRRAYEAAYMDCDGHTHIHGANLGVDAAAYRRAGGFPALALSEDVGLVNALLATGANVAWSARPRVATSSRRIGRADGGFASLLNRLSSIAEDALIPLTEPLLPLGRGA